MGKPMYRPEIDKVQRDRCYTCQGAGIIGGGEWDIERTHGRLAKVQYDIGCKDAEEYAGKLRKEGWKSWSLEVNGTRVTEVMHLPYTNTAHQNALPCLERLNAAVIARMSADEPTGEERLELLRASKEASEILGQNDQVEARRE